MTTTIIPSKHRRYYTPKDVGQHNSADDCWVSIFHLVFDLSKLITENRGSLAQPIINHAGEDLSHWFDPASGDVKTHIDPTRHICLPFLPHGRFLDVAPPEPVSTWSTLDRLPWWKDHAQYGIGQLTKNTRHVEVVNVLTQQSMTLEVCAEETIDEIQDRYMELFNSHASSYTWKHLADDTFVPLDMAQTLEENGIEDESLEFEQLGMDAEEYKPILHVYFNDDLTVL